MPTIQQLVRKGREQMSEQITKQMRKKGTTKLALYNDADLQSTSILYWTLPYESLLMSQTNGDKPQLTFFFVNKDNKELINTLHNAKGMVISWGIIEANHLIEDILK